MGGGGGGGRNRAGHMAIALGGTKDASDPAIAPLVRYAAEWWLSAGGHDLAIRPPMLARLFRFASGRFPRQASWRASVRGPLAAALWAAGRAGCTFINATHITDCRGCFLDLVQQPPAFVQRWLVNARRI